MIFAVSGTQGCGKSSVLTELKNRGHNVTERKTSRSVLGDWGVTLDEVYSNPNLAIEFQEECLKRKVEDEALLSADPDSVWITERSYADLVAYTTFSLGNLSTHSDWFDDYVQRCMQHQRTYEQTFLIKAGAFQIENDGVRNPSTQFNRAIELIIADLLQQHSTIIIKSTSITARCDEIEYIMAKVR